MIFKIEKEDFETVGKLYTDNWKSTYENIISSEILEHMNYDGSKDKWINYCKEEKQGIFVWKEDKNVLGFIAYKPCPMNENCLMLDSLHVFSSCQGKGIGKKLIMFTLNFAKENGYDKASICIVRGNDRAESMYKKLGAILQKDFTDSFYGINVNSSILIWENLK